MRPADVAEVSQKCQTAANYSSLKKKQMQEQLSGDFLSVLDGWQKHDFVIDKWASFISYLLIVDCVFFARRVISGQRRVRWWNLMKSGASYLRVKLVNIVEALIHALNSSFIQR